MEAIGDITASAEVSQLSVDGEEFDTRIQGGILVSTLGPTHRSIDDVVM
jgi:xanthine/uracil permease